MATQPVNHLSTVVGRNISAAREAAGLTQMQLASELGTSISRVSGWERGEHLPSKKQQPAIADLLFAGDVMALFREPAETGKAAA